MAHPPNSMMTQVYRDLLSYQRWAGDRLAHWIEELPDSWLDTPVAGSFPSVRANLLHMADAERIWLRLLQGQAVTTWPSKEAGAATDPLGEYLRRSTAAFADHAAKQSDAWFRAWCDFTGLSGKRRRIANGGIVQHVVNHSTYHRGQVIGQVRLVAEQSGALDSMPGIPDTDYITWLSDQQASLPGTDPDLERIYGG